MGGGIGTGASLRELNLGLSETVARHNECTDTHDRYKEGIHGGILLPKDYDRYEELLQVKKCGLIKNKYTITERDSEKGLRITQLDSQTGTIIRED